ncbi:hypothetical protein [Nocardia transvalensis]|nr:hypothetical protein [Nocardia transvalensis]MBF6333011.1 hypothetical protein [Nocardia transvalensis]
MAFLVIALRVVGVQEQLAAAGAVTVLVCSSRNLVLSTGRRIPLRRRVFQ